MTFLIWLVQCLIILLSVAFFTLFERKVIGLFHIRLGPNKVRFIGVFQPLLDAFKLLSKQNTTPYRSNKFTFNLAPNLALILALFVWVSLPCFYIVFSMNYSFVLFFCVGSIIVFSVLLAGWSSNSKYSLIGRLRSVAQSISYESILRTLLVLFVCLINSFSIFSFISFSSVVFILLLPIWFICTLAETHRAPFDFRESESELVRGFNTEYSGAYFAFIFLSEYSILLFSTFLISFIFFRIIINNNLIILLFFTLVFSFVFIWIRVTFCRFRYDMLMIRAWKIFLPLTLIVFIVIISFII